MPLRRCVDASVAWARLDFAGSMPFDEFVTSHILEEAPASGGAAAAPRDDPQLFDYSIWQQCADILGDEVRMPKWFGVDLYTHTTAAVGPVTGSAAPTLFLAKGGTSSSLHVDFLHTNFWMAMCHGRKRWRLVPREDLALLYPRYLNDLNPVFPFDLDQAFGEGSVGDGVVDRRATGAVETSI